MLDVRERLPALWTQALGPLASRQTAPFIQNHCQEKKQNKKQTHKGWCWHTLQELWHLATCDSFWWKMRLHVTQQPCPWISSDSCDNVGIGWLWLWVLLYFDLSFFWMSKHIHHRTTEDIMHLWSQARATQSVSTVCGSELEWWANSYDTATIALRLFRFIDDSM